MKVCALLPTLHEGRAWMTNVTLGLFGSCLLLLARQFVSESHHFTIGYSGCSGWSALLYIASIIIVLTQPADRITFWIVICFAIAFRMETLFADPFSSTDIYRYVWDGIVQHAHISPYRFVPGDPALTFLRAPHQHIFENINRRNYARTIYPPVAQMIYWVLTLVSPTVFAMKTGMFLFECATTVALLLMLRHMGRPWPQILLYAWCPLLVWEIGGAGHIDAAVFAFVSFALLFRFRERPILVGVCLALAVMTKFYPVVLFPALYKRGDWKMPAAFITVCLLSYAPYISVGRLVFGFLFDYTKEEGIDSGARFFLLDLLHSVRNMPAIPVGAYIAFCAIVLGSISVWTWMNTGQERLTRERPLGSTPAFVQAAMMLGFAMMLLFSPHYPWYIVWLIPLFTLVPNLPLLAYLMSFFYLFTTALADPGPRMFLLNKILYGVVAITFLLHLALKKYSVLFEFLGCRYAKQHIHSLPSKQLD